MSDSQDEYLFLLVALDDEESWNLPQLKEAIKEIQDLVNAASSITGIYTATLIVDYWDGLPVITYWVQHDHRYGELSACDEMIQATFSKAIELAGYDEDCWVLDEDERASIGTE